MNTFFRPLHSVLLWLLLLCPATGHAAAFLFDATKAETAGNADWVVDEDNKIVGRYPTPTAAGIISSTVETYWTGALSSWGVALVKLGYTVESLPVGGRITYLDATNAQDLSNYQVYVVCEPNVLFTSAERTAIARYVQDGGSLFVISDHTGSDRNNDGYDSVAVWNDFFNNNGVQVNPFGLTINSTNVSLVSNYADTAPDDPLTNGPIGPASLLKYSNGATLTLNTTANSSVRGAFWIDAAHGNSNAMAAYGRFGAGRYAVMCDSSPIDDGTGGSGHTLYYGWTEEGANHSNLILNASVWLAARDGGAPYNDAFANASPLDPGANLAGGSNVAATSESGEPNPTGTASGNSVWWQFTPANSGVVTISTQGSAFDTVLAVYTGSAVGALTPVAQNDNVDSANTYSVVTFAVTAGTTYRVSVDGVGGATGNIVLGLSFPAPAYDLFTGAITVASAFSSATSYNGNNFNAGVETGEPSHAGYSSAHTVWWRWTPTANAGVTISTVGSDFDTLLAVYTGGAVNALSTVASNANYGSLLQSQLSFNAVAGTTYSIAVAGYTTATGHILLTLTPGNPNTAPANDNFTNAIALAGSSATGTATTTYATEETGEPRNITFSEAHSVWWRWNSPGNGSVTLTTVGSSFDTTLGVYVGSSVGALTTLATDDDSGGSTKSKIAMNTLADTTYFIKVDGYGGTSGTVKLNLTYSTSPLPPPANDNFAAATVLTGTTSTVTGTTVSATTETDEPALYGGGHTVWYRWTAPGDLIVSASCYGGNMVLGIYTGTPVNALTNLITAPNGYGAFLAQAGTTYSFCVDAGSSGVTGGFTFYLSTQPFPSISLTVSPVRIAEGGDTPGTFTLTPSAYAPVPLTVHLNVGGSAAAGLDYACDPSPAANGTVSITIPAYYPSWTYDVYALPDNDPTEGDETIVATLLAGSGYTVNAAAATATAAIADSSPYSAAWESGYRAAGFSGPTAALTADPDGDGVSNLLEFAFNMNPLASDAPGALPTVGTGEFADPADANGASRRFLTLSFTRRTDASGLTYAVMTTESLTGGAWSADGAVLVSASGDGMPANTERAIYRTVKPLNGPNASPGQCLRVIVSASGL